MLKISINNGRFMDVDDINKKYKDIINESDEFTIEIRCEEIDTIHEDIDTLEKRIVFNDLIQLDESEMFVVLNFYDLTSDKFENITVIPVLDTYIGEFKSDIDAAYEYVETFYNYPISSSSLEPIFSNDVLRAICDSFLIKHNNIYYECY